MRFWFYWECKNGSCTFIGIKNNDSEIPSCPQCGKPMDLWVRIPMKEAEK